MYIAHTTIHQSQIPLYVSILNKLISGEVDTYKNQIDDSINEAKKVIQGEKTIFSISNDKYFLISNLIENGRDFLNGLTKSNYDNEDYQRILDILQSSK